MGIALKVLESIVKSLWFNANYSAEDQRAAYQKSREFTSDFFDYLRQAYPMSFKEVGFTEKQLGAIGSLISLVDEGYIHESAKGGYFSDGPKFVINYEGTRTRTYSQRRIRMHGRPALFFPMDMTRTEYMSMWDLKTDFPADHAFALQDMPYEPVDGIHFKFLPKKGESPEDFDRYWTDLSRKGNRAVVYGHGERVDIFEESGGLFKPKTEDKYSFYYVGSFKREEIGQEIHVYAHNCHNSHKTSRLADPSFSLSFRKAHDAGHI